MPEENVLFARETDTPPATDDVTAEAQASKYLICISDGLLYGVDAEQVETIITDHTITRLPRVPHYASSTCGARSSPSSTSASAWESPRRTRTASWW